jgi:hypothetical protein
MVKRMRRLNPDALIGGVLLVLCVELFRETYNFRIPPFATMSTGTWPRFVLVLLAVLSVALIAQALLQPRSEPPIDSPLPTATASWMSHRNALICFGLFAVFLVTLPWLGMLLGGVAFVFLMQELMGPRDAKSRVIHLAISIIAVGGMWAVFTFALRVILPEGVLLRM